MKNNVLVMKPGKTGYKIMFNENTVVMSYKFAKAASQYGTKEYKILKGIRKDIPGINEVVVSGREQKSPRANTRLTYENMEAHIQGYENAQELLDVFETVKAMSASAKSPYKYVSDWFKMQFPNYNKAPVFANGKLTVAPVAAPAIKEYKVKLAS